VGPADVAPRIFTILRALVNEPSTALTAAITEVTSVAADQVARITQEATAIANAAEATAEAEQARLEGALADARERVTAVTSDFQARISTARRSVDAAREAGDQAIASAQQQAEQLRAAAQAAAVDPAELDRVEQRALQLVSDAEQTAADRVADAQQQVDDLTAQLSSAQAQLDAAVSTATQEVAAAGQRLADLAASVQQRIDDEVARLTALAQQTAAAVTALPGQALALAEDGRRQLVSVLEEEVSLLGLITQALVYLKDQLFPDEQRLQIVAYSNPAAQSPGIGASWVDGDVKALLAFSPDLGGPMGSLVIEASTPDGSPIEFSVGSPAQMTLKTSGNQSTVLGFDAPPAPTGDGDVEVAVGFDTSDLSVDRGLLSAEAGTPRVGLRLSARDGEWHYRVSAALAGARWELDLDDALDPIPNLLPLPEIVQKRTFEAVYSDGVFSYVESAV
jgi:hypothetical protein